MALRDLLRADERYSRALAESGLAEPRGLTPGKAMDELSKAARARRDAMKRAHAALQEGDASS